MMQVITKWNIVIQFEDNTAPMTLLVSDNHYQNVLMLLAKIDFGLKVSEIKVEKLFI